MRRIAVTASLIAVLILAVTTAQAQHLWWGTKEMEDATCLYGEITVLATNPGIYFCGANWHPGESAGGYCGIQHNSPKERRTIFSIWDTGPKLYTKVTVADSDTIFRRFGGEGTGGHTHMLWDWKVKQTFRFFVEKRPANTPGMTDAFYYIYDPNSKQWRYSATVTSPNGDENSRPSVTKIGGGGLASFLENFTGRDRSVAKLALYRLWLGSAAGSMKCLTKAIGDGVWGKFNDAYFLAEGGTKELKALFQKLRNGYGKPVFGRRGEKLKPISDKPLDKKLIKQLRALPHPQVSRHVLKRSSSGQDPSR